MTRTAAEVRQEFLDFFRQRGHVFVPSSPVVPHDDPTLLFANAGMNQFKPYFLGTETPKHRRAANTQKCIRAGGKHNDLDDVGHDTYHHTFFEMLGNWSFGDYFKKEAIGWAWELLTKVWGLDKTRLHATYFGGDPAEGLEPDIEARDLWLAVMQLEGLDASHVHPGNKKDNFWEMGETGPCGPCSEIHIDLTPDKSGAKLVNAGDARVIEIWNLVFIQFNRAAGGTLTPLPAKHVDTGMGFERVTAVLQGHNNNYATDVFVPIIQAIEKISGYTYGVGSAVRTTTGARDSGQVRTADPTRYAVFAPGNMQDEACRVIADHIRTLTFAITDGAVPDKDGRGYVLRRILRRAVRYGWQYLDVHEPFLYKLVPTVVEFMGDAFPELRKNPQHVAEIIREEEESFERTLDRGIALFEEAIAIQWGQTLAQRMAKVFGSISPLEARATKSPATWGLTLRDPVTGEREFLRVDTTQVGRAGAPILIPGDVAFRLHDTYGFPIDLTQIMAQERGLTVDIAEYERLMGQARERARAGWRGEGDWLDAMFDALPDTEATKFVGYEELAHSDAEVLHVVRSDGLSSAAGLQTDETGVIVLDKTPFYAEAGGQVGDRGIIRGVPGQSWEPQPANVEWEFRVEDTKRIGPITVHYGTCVRGPIQDTCEPDCISVGHPPPSDRGPHWITRAVAEVTESSRRATMKNHTATHVMNWALREVLGEHVQQKGSLVDPEKTRFDFSHPRALTPEEIERVEQLVNDKIKARLTVDCEEVDQQQALKINGLRAVFGERYPDRVRVMSVGVPVAELVKNPDNPKWREISIEFCGGTHVKNTADIEHFVIASEEAVAKGVRRIVGLTGDMAKAATDAGAALIQHAEALKRGPTDAVSAGLGDLQAGLASATIPLRQRHRLNELIADLQAVVKEQHKSEAADAAEVVKHAVAELLEHAEKIGGTTVVVGEMPDVPIEQLKMGADQIKQKCGSAAVLFGVRVMSVPGASATGPDVASASRGQRVATESADNQRRPQGGDATPGAAGKAILLAAMTPDLVKKGLKAGDLVKLVAPIVGGGGGGPPTMAQAGGKNPDKLPEALDAGRKWISDRLARDTGC